MAGISGGLKARAVNLLVAEQHNGPVGDARLISLRGCVRFEGAAKVSDEDAPNE